MGRVARYAMAVLIAALGWGAAVASATPGWICIPTTGGQPVVSGGAGPLPSCSGSTTVAVAPTFISSGVGGKPTAQFAAVNVQIVSGLGTTDDGGNVDGEGNLVVGYAENPDSLAQTGSNNLIVGSGNGWEGFGSIVGGFGNDAIGDFESVFDNASTTGAGISTNPASVTFPEKKCTTRLVTGTVTFTTTHSRINRAGVETATRQTVSLR
jgi:hypothetical protein